MSADEVAVRALYQQLMDAWNMGSGEAFAAPFAEDGHLIGFDGVHFHGHQEIVPFHEQLFQTHLKGTRLIGSVRDVQFLAPEIALMHAIGSTVMRGKKAPARERDSIQTLVARKSHGQWRLVAFQNTRIRPMGRTIGGTLVWLLSDWLWKVMGGLGRIRSGKWVHQAAHSASRQKRARKYGVSHGDVKQLG